MATTETIDRIYENNDPTRVHWRAIAVGGFVTVLTYMILMSLGLAISASGLQSVIDTGSGGQALGMTAAAWVLGSVLISLFVGSYTSSRANRQTTPRVGAIQGAVIVSGFFILAALKMGLMMGAMGRGISDITGNIMGQAANVAEDPRVSALVEDNFGDLKYRQPFEQVAKGVVARVMRGDNDSAKNYLAAQTGISREQAADRLDEFSGKLQATLQQIGDKAAEALKTGGWIAFGTLILSSIIGVLGGMTGAHVSLRRAGEVVTTRKPTTRGHHRTAHANA